MKYIKILLGWVKEEIFYLFISIISLIIVTYTLTIVPLFYQHAYDKIIVFEADKPTRLPDLFVNFINNGQSPLDKLLYLGIALVALQLLRASLMFLSGRSNAVFSEKVAYKLRVRLYNHIQNLPYSYHTQAETGDLIQRSTSDVDTVRRFIGTQFPEIFRIVFLFIFVLIQMFAINVELTLISLIVVPIIFSFAFIFFKRIQKVFTETDESEGKMSTALQENLTGIRVVKAFAREKYEIERFNKFNRKYSNNVQKIINNMAYYWSSSDIICMLQIGSTIVLGSLFAVRGLITVGDLVAFSGFINFILWPIRQLARIIVELGKSTVSVKRIQEVLDEETEYQEKDLEKPEINGDITFDHVSFTFDDASVPTLEDISFNIKKGETISIIGKTGSGKSTLAHLLVRLYDYTSGSIKIDGVELNSIDKHWIRKNIGIVLQEPFLFSKTIYENIGIISDNPDDEAVYKAASSASIHEDILHFDKGYKTLIGERGVTLSGGQRQRVAIARMLVKNLPIIIFDDSLSAVDTETDLSIRKALSDRSNDLTKIIITHRISTAMEADKIIVLEDGKILEMGSHQELVENDKVYKKIWSIQSTLEEKLNKEEVI
ncbi:ABC transporter ATP-binding protein [Mycoplasmatota bacterium]|nr:ABC transporter ATP-binding protein [Mycoplasmatota bacterium]